tara:strand:- start:108 stop:542 length:435 start_codon:yes stop_codon:yes gene_type:complete
MSTLKVTNVKHETSGLNTLVFDNGGSSGGNGRVTTKGTIGEISPLGDKTGDITIDFKTANNFSMTLTGNSTLKNPTTLAAGQSGVIFITQGSGGNKQLSYESYWDFPDGGTPPVLSTTATQVDMIVWVARSSTKISAQLVANFS